MEIEIGGGLAGAKQLRHDEPLSPDSVRIGDGTRTVNTTADNELMTNDAAAITVLETLATETTLAAINAKTATLVNGRVPVEIGASINLNVEDANFQTEVTNFPASQAVTGPLTDAELRATPVPVSASTLPLPTGAATDATLTTLINLVDGLEGLTTTQNATLTSMGTTLGTRATEATLIEVRDELQLAHTSQHQGYMIHTSVRIPYNLLNVSTVSWQEVVASVAMETSRVEIFDSSGSTLQLGFGAPGGESVVMHVFPGGNGLIPWAIPAGTRLSIRSAAGVVNSGEFLINLYSY